MARFLTLLNVLASFVGLHGAPMEEAIIRSNSSNSPMFFILWRSNTSTRYTLFIQVIQIIFFFFLSVSRASEYQGKPSHMYNNLSSALSIVPLYPSQYSENDNGNKCISSPLPRNSVTTSVDRKCELLPVTYTSAFDIIKKWQHYHFSSLQRYKKYLRMRNFIIKKW